ncbi:carboxylate-amine ligase [Pseudomonas sp. PD9R]|uniref:carboxylate-amine ligase n=1 Tax=Pseudomonas sp. PD9R TaxID=2853534 RepID=UPI001C43D71A|nr:carboxylate-amine ligase [Pseudomonas sp. PD9R]MBV6821991.1 carboxylate-amine ligase [Pseudomonas sp. PD9R]
MSPAPRFGIEEEYFLTDLSTRQMLAEPSADLLRECREAMEQGFAYEMFQGQIEVASPVFSTAEQAAEFLGGVRSRLNRMLAKHGLGLLCAGSHPLARWRDQRATVLPHFDQLFFEYQSVAQRSVLCGLHVHVEIPQGIDRIAVMNEVAPWLPLLLMLSCSSPFWEGADSGFMSYRQVVCDGWPRMGIPEFFGDESEYQRYLKTLQQIGTIEKEGNGWWGLRPASRYPTLELRMTDACPRLSDALLLASLFRVMVAFAISRPDPGARYEATTRWLLAENRWQAKRHGVQGRYVTDAQSGLISAGQWLEQARSLLAPTAKCIGEPQVFDQAEALLDFGNSASRQLACYARALAQGSDAQGCMHQVVDQLLQESRN